MIPVVTILSYNFGDALNLPVLRTISDEQFDNYINCSSENTRFSAIGSIAFLWTGKTIVWGSGVLDENRTCSSNLKSMEFKLVRGPKTRTHLLNKGYANIPEIYCDPGILASYCYRDILSQTKDFDLGIFFHHSEDSRILLKSPYFTSKTCLLNPNSPIDITIRNISRCKRIVSSSLHGIIVAESLGIPCSWYRGSDINDPFKFYDYFEGTKRFNVMCNDIRGMHITNVDFKNLVQLPKPVFNINGLLNTFPYRLKDGIQEKILKFYIETGVYK